MDLKNRYQYWFFFFFLVKCIFDFRTNCGSTLKNNNGNTLYDMKIWGVKHFSIFIIYKNIRKRKRVNRNNSNTKQYLKIQKQVYS